MIDQREAHGAAITRPRDSSCPIARRVDHPVIRACSLIWAAVSIPPGASTPNTAASAMDPVAIANQADGLRTSMI
ncbi:hypothetical protein ACWCW7_05635 [Nocardia tengchongensis]